jgi:hypothetical protein
MELGNKVRAIPPSLERRKIFKTLNQSLLGARKHPKITHYRKLSSV